MSVTAYRRTMTETEMRVAITEAVARIGGRVFHVHDSRYAPAMADFPDLVILLPSKGRVLFVELKSWRRPITDGQMEVLQMLDQCPDVYAFVVRSEARDLHELSLDRFMDWLTA